MQQVIRWGLAATIALGAACGVRAQEVYRGICDASAAVAIGGGHFVVADDEADVLQVYRRGVPEPVAALDLTDYLHNRKPNGKATEADIEGAAAIGERIYWISSHARKGGDGSEDRHRWRFFATDRVGGAAVPSLQPVAHGPYETLLDDLLADRRFKLLVRPAGKKPEAKDGLNIEGLAATPQNGLLIGFRNPLPKGRALVVPLLNPREVVERGAKPVFGDLLRLDLDQRGIRSLERVGDAFLVVAGPTGEADRSPVTPSFALFRWTGVAGDAPRLIRPLDSGTFRPEALFYDPDAKGLYLLSDDGDEPSGDKTCKQRKNPGRKAFRAMAVPWTP
jgi:hypothetical protein